jgi:hypothetical protein
LFFNEVQPLITKKSFEKKEGKDRVTHFKIASGFLKMANVIQLHLKRDNWSIFAGLKVQHQ